MILLLFRMFLILPGIFPDLGILFFLNTLKQILNKSYLMETIFSEYNTRYLQKRHNISL